ncbi:MAG: FAD-dependent oxidoreductase [Magnetovibrionaceae bacterium]
MRKRVTRPLAADDHIPLLVVGAGGAGCAAALEAKQAGIDVVIVTKADALDSKTARSQGGVQAALGPGDSAQTHFQDTISAGNSKNNPELVRLMVEQAPQIVAWLEGLGVAFDRNDQGYVLKQAAGLTHPRVLGCGDETGRRIIAPLLEAVERAEIPLFEQTAVETLRAKTTAEGTTGFVVELHQEAGRFEITADSVILATGGLIPRERRAGMVFEGPSAAPDGAELGQEIGADLINPDLSQMHPTGVISPEPLRREVLPETVRGLGANLLNRHREPFTDPLATRQKLTDAIVRECEAGNGVETPDGRQGVWLTTPDVDRINGPGTLAETIPRLYSVFREYGVDLSSEPVLVYPVLHYSLGGLVINQNAETTVPGLFAAGEVTWGVHGEDRLMGNSLTDIFVFGRRAGVCAARYLSGSKAAGGDE